MHMGDARGHTLRTPTFEGAIYETEVKQFNPCITVGIVYTGNLWLAQVGVKARRQVCLIQNHST